MPRFAGTPVEDDAKKPRFGGVPVASPQEPEGQGYAPQIFSGLLEGATGALGAPVDLVNNLIVAPAFKGVNAVFGTDLQPSEAPLGGSAGLRQGLAISPPSDDTGKQMARRVSQSVGGAAIPLANSSTIGQAAAGLGTAVGGGVGGAIAQQLFPNNAWADVAGELIGGLGTGAAIRGVSNRSAQRAAEESVPSVEQLKAQAGDKFEDAHRAGITASQQQTQALATDMRSIAQQEGLISPTGRVSEAYPKAREALRMIDDYAQGGMDIPQMQTARKVLADAAKSPDDAERRIATMMLRKFDDFTSPLAPQLAEGRALYGRAMRGEQLETMRELAEANRSKYSASGVENALRNEYRSLSRRIIKGQERGWSPEQADAIRRVDEGTSLSNTARNLGKAAPTGPVSFMGSVGVPGLLGTAMGGPAVGAALATGAAMGGYGARSLATAMGMRNAEIAELLARNGGPLNVTRNRGLDRSMLEALAAALLGSQSR